MKVYKVLFLAVVLILGIIRTARAQSVGINSTGNTPNSSAMLDVNTTNKGLLIPNVALTGTTDATTISTPAVSLLVYNTATASGVTPGYYYNSGTSDSPVWTRLLTTAADGSETKVTSGTNATVTGTGITSGAYVVSAGFAFLTQTQRNALTPFTGQMIYNTSTDRPNYYRGDRWRNFDGTSADLPAVGDVYQGGIVAYVFQSGDPGYIPGEVHGLIAAPSDIIEYWHQTYYNALITTGATETALGTGNANTEKIVSVLGNGTYAAKYCYDLVLNGYNDWYLPSRDELYKLFLSRAAVGGYDLEYFMYWSSSEYSKQEAWFMYFAGSGRYYKLYKIYALAIRAVRTF